MRLNKTIYLTLLLLACLINNGNSKSQPKQAVIDDVVDAKDFKKLLRTKTNILVLFVNGQNSKEIANVLGVFREAATAVRGTGTMLLIDCAQSDRKKLCKKLKVNAQPYVLKHYKEGDYHKDYDRQLTLSSMVTFMRDPGGDLPWQEDPAGADVLHFSDYGTFQKHLRKDPRPMLVMFYVPWCGYCKRLKPDFSKAASQLKEKGGHYVLAAMDVERNENSPARRAYNITGFPTILYFERGQVQLAYEGENNEAALVSFMEDPTATPPPKPKEEEWSADPNSEIVHLTSQGFMPALADEPSVLVMFYAPWCGHCKRLKPEWERAAILMKEQQIGGVLAALDATKETSIGEKYKIKGYPTLKYFVHGELKFDVNLRDADKIVEFMRNPSEPPPPPPPETPWEDDEDAEAVYFLNDSNFVSTLKRKKHALVMFYAPWCGHCKSTKPEFTAAAQLLQDDPRIAFVAVDCTRHAKLCSQYEVRGYPTIKYFSFLKTQLDYNSGRTRKDFVAYMTKSDRDTKQHSEL